MLARVNLDSACEVGCTQCADSTGACLSCKSGFSQDQNDQKTCNPDPQITSTGTTCPELAFSNGTSCQPCASPCQSCSGGTSNDCTACVQGQYMLNGVCVKANSDGVCEGTSLIADNNKKACDACRVKCTTCKIPNFSIASLASQAQCTSCVPGTFLSNGACVDACPPGTFVSSQDNMSCLCTYYSFLEYHILLLTFFVSYSMRFKLWYLFRVSHFLPYLFKLESARLQWHMFCCLLLP